MQDITFGITSFNRPELLQNLVRSILHRYPLAHIVVADNGQQHAILPNRVKHLKLPFDCGLSQARNALVDQLQTKYLLILEDDFLFTDETCIEPLKAVLEADPTVGVVGGALRTVHGRIAAYALDIEVFRDTMVVREATHRLYFTPCGTPYRLCDMIWNFALFRKEMLEEHRWLDRLKVGEHCPYFHQVKLAGRWRVAACAETRIYHVPEHRSPDYLKYRRRAEKMFEGYLAEYGIKNYHRVLPYHFEDDEHDKPPVIILGVGHSGTTVLSKMLMRLGWNGADADEEFGESVSIRMLNQVIEATGKLPRERALGLIKNLPRPWVIKDPRFVQTLHHWMPLFQLLDQKPVLLRIRRDRNAMLASYGRRSSPGDVAYRIDNHLDECQRQYERWPWGRFTLDYELLAAAVTLFDTKRANNPALQLPPQSTSHVSMPMLDSRGVSSEVGMLLHFLCINRDSAIPVTELKELLTHTGLGHDSSSKTEHLLEIFHRSGLEHDSAIPRAKIIDALKEVGLAVDSRVCDVFGEAYSVKAEPPYG